MAKKILVVVDAQNDFITENACACVTPESHKTAIEAMKMIQVNII